MADTQQVTRHPEAQARRDRAARVQTNCSAVSPPDARGATQYLFGARRSLFSALVGLLLAIGCTPHQQMRLGSTTQALPMPPGGKSRATAANAQRTAGQDPTASHDQAAPPAGDPAHGHSAHGDSAHGEKLDPFEIEKPPLDDEQAAAVHAPSIDAPNNPGDPVETSKTSLAAEGSLTQTNLLDEDLSVETDHSRAIDAPMSELVRAPSGSGDAKLADSAVKSVLLASHTEEADAAIAPGANDAGPPSPPWMKREQQTDDSRPDNTAAVTHTGSSRRSTATTAAKPNSPSPAQSRSPDETFDPFAGTTFAASDSSEDTSASTPVDTGSEAAQPADANARPSATAIAAQMMAQRAKRNARRAANTRRTDARPTAETPAKAPAKSSEPPYVGPPIPQELTASMGDTLLKYASFSETPAITPISIVYTPQMDVDAEVLAMEEAVHGATPATAASATAGQPATAARPAKTAQTGMKSQPAATKKKKASRGNPVRTASRPTPSSNRSQASDSQPAGDSKSSVSTGSATGVSTASLQTPVPPSASTDDTGMRDADKTPDATNPPASGQATTDDAPAQADGWQPVRREPTQPWKSKP